MAKSKKIAEEKTITLSYSGCIKNAFQKDLNVLDLLMRKFQSAKRFSRERIFENKERKEIVELTKPLFISNSRYMRDAFLEAEANISSQKELLPTYVIQNENKIEKLEKQIEKLVKNKKKSKQVVLYKQNIINKLQKEIKYYQHHIDNNTVPKTIDGTKRRLKLLNKKKISKEIWRDVRSNALFSRGEKSKGGNENIKLSYLKDNLFEIKILNPLSNKKGDRLKFTVAFPEKFVQTLVQYLATGESYTIRIKRENGKYLVHVTLENDIIVKPNFTNGVAGMDINPDNFSVTIVTPNGNFKTSKVFWMNDINTVSSDKRDWIVQNTLYEVIAWIKSFKIDTLVIENLKFLQSNGSSKFNRMSHNFSYSNMIKSLFSILFKESIALVQVDAYYSSFIGKVKYQQMYGLSIHQSAAFVLARRGLSLKEKMPKNILSVLFTKEVKKGQEVSDLFKHWKKAKTWFDEMAVDLRNKKISTKGMFFSQILECKNKEVEDLFAVQSLI